MPTASTNSNTSTNADTKTRMVTSPTSLWPYAIIAWFIVFISGLGTWAVVAVRQDMDLVRPDYYEAEIRYQQQMDRVARALAFREEIAIALDGDGDRRAVVLRLPAAHAAPGTTGDIQFYRASDARLDLARPLALDAQGFQRIDAGKMRAGLWKVRVQWTVAGQEYYFDQNLVL